jgi:hypothetical protein
VQFNEERLIGDAGLVIAATLAERLGVEELVNESIWLPSRTVGAALPGRKVMTLVHGMLAGADSVDDMNPLRAGSTQLILGHRVMAPSTLGTFLRAFTFGHVRQLGRVLGVALARAWEAGASPGGLPLVVVDLASFIGEIHGYEKQGAGYGVHAHVRVSPGTATRADTGEVRHLPNRKGQANTQRGAERFVEELLAGAHRAGHRGSIALRADSGFENHKLTRALDQRGVEFSIGAKQSNQARALIDQIPETEWVTIEDYPETRAGPDRRDNARWLAADRPPHPTHRRSGRTLAGPALPHPRYQPHRPDAHSGHRPSRPRSSAHPPRPFRPPRSADDTRCTSPARSRTPAADEHSASPPASPERPTSPPCSTRSARSPPEPDPRRTTTTTTQPPTANRALTPTQKTPKNVPRERPRPPNQSASPARQHPTHSPDLTPRNPAHTSHRRGWRGDGRFN